MDKSAIVLTNDSSSMFEQDKGCLLLADKPLIRHVVDAVRRYVDEVVVVARSKEQIAAYNRLLPNDVLFVEVCDVDTALVGALAGFDAACGKYSLLVSFDMPFVSGDVVSLLFDLCGGKAAVVPRWTDGQIESLHSVYQKKMALETARCAVDEGALDMQAMIDRLRGVRFVSTLVLQQLDPDCKTFFTVNSPLDLKKATFMLKPKRSK